MNHPDFSIRDWEDFSKVIKNAYWHQEDSPTAEDVLSALEGRLLSQRDWGRALDGLMDHWIDSEEEKLASEREIYMRLRNQPVKDEIKDVQQLRAAIGCIIDEMNLADQAAAGSTPLSGFQVSTADRVELNVLEAWKRFQEAGFVFSPLFSYLRDELLEGERQAFSREPLHKRVAFVKAVMSDTLTSRYREAAESEYLKKTEDKASLLPGSFRLSIRRLLRLGASREQIKEGLGKTLSSNRDLRHRLLREALRGVIQRRQVERLCRFNGSLPPASTASEHKGKGALTEVFPDLEESLETILDRHRPLDRERLLHYLFLLAKMEVNLDTLTALLREIRETSDVIEAAWLRFTQERLVEGPGPKTVPSVLAGLPLLASRLKEKEPVSRGLVEGVSRKEKKNVASAVAEIRNIIRFHILVSMERHPGRNSIQPVLEDIQNGGYDLSGIDEEALKRAVDKEWSRRDQLASQKIWIYTTVTARRLAIQHTELQEAEREFYKARLDLLKEEDGSDGHQHYQELTSRRGVALGQIKEEMYRQLSDLLESERIATFQNRIRQIVAQLDRKREDIYRGWLEAEINSRTIFYLLRQYQKDEQEPTWSDFERFLRNHWFLALRELRASRRPDREERIKHLDDRFKALLGVSLLELESEAAAAAGLDYQKWMDGQLEKLDNCRLSTS